jgi:hypothetical protein
MPNHCDNWVRISGNAEILQILESQPFTLELGDPLPEEMRDPIISTQAQVEEIPEEYEEEEEVVLPPPLPVLGICRTIEQRPVDNSPPVQTTRVQVDSSEWIQTHWGTRWIAPMGDHHADLHLTRARDGSLQAFFISAWSPPLPFYNRLAEKYPSITIEYEYTEWGVGFCGYGVGRPGGEPNHFNFETREDMRALNEMRQWTLHIWNPHYLMMKTDSRWM